MSMNAFEHLKISRISWFAVSISISNLSEELNTGLNLNFISKLIKNSLNKNLAK